MSVISSCYLFFFFIVSCSIYLTSMHFEFPHIEFFEEFICCTEGFVGMSLHPNDWVRAWQALFNPILITRVSYQIQATIGPPLARFQRNSLFQNPKQDLRYIFSERLHDFSGGPTSCTTKMTRILTIAVRTGSLTCTRDLLGVSTKFLRSVS